MLTATATHSFAEASFRCHAALEREFRLFSVERRGSIWDNRFCRGADRLGGGGRVLLILVDGWIKWHEGGLGTLRAPAAFVSSVQALDGVRSPDGARTSGGAPYRAVELVLVADPASDTRPTAVALPERVLHAARETFERFNDDPTTTVRHFLEQSATIFPAAAGLSETLVAGESADVLRISDAIASALLGDPFPQVNELIERSGLSASHFARKMTKLLDGFHLDWEGWRQATNDMRLRWATLLLSRPELTIAEIARASGYANTDVLDATFRRMQLPSPREVRRQILAAAADVMAETRG